MRLIEPCMVIYMVTKDFPCRGLIFGCILFFLIVFQDKKVLLCFTVVFLFSKSRICERNNQFNLIIISITFPRKMLYFYNISIIQCSRLTDFIVCNYWTRYLVMWLLNLYREPVFHSHWFTPEETCACLKLGSLERAGCCKKKLQLPSTVWLFYCMWVWYWRKLD